MNLQYEKVDKYSVNNGKTYIIKKVNNELAEKEDVWEDVPKIEVNSYPWDVNGYQPRTEVQMFYTDNYFKLRFISHEKSIKVNYFKMNESVCKDSCMEFFLIPNIQQEAKYMNFEFNAVGNLLLGIGINRNNRKLIDSDRNIFKIKTSVNIDNIKEYSGDSWMIECTIPFVFLEIYYGEIDFKSGHRMKANFYKCGDNTDYPHFGCWSPILNSKPDFHIPQFFGDLILE